MAGQCAPRTRTEASRAAVACRAALAAGLVWALAACNGASPPPSASVAANEAYLTKAVSDAQAAAKQADALYQINRKQRAAVHMEEVEVILQRARKSHDRVKAASDAAAADLAALRRRVERDAHEAESNEVDPMFASNDNAALAAATDRAERARTELAQAERDIATIEAIVADLRKKGIPGRI